MLNNQLQFHEYLNDPIWGEIPVTKIEWDLINTPTFRRLQHVKQMGLAYLSFPTANHRRFEHCIGTMHVSTVLFDILADVIKHNKLDSEFNNNHLQALRIASLLHDIGHPPYSHAFEEAISKNPDFITFSQKTIFNKAKCLAPLLDNPGVYSHELFTSHIIQNDPYISKIIIDYDELEGFFPPKEIASLSIGKATQKGLLPFNSILSGDFDADRIDYVCRDSYYCGFQQRFNIADLRRNLLVTYTKADEKFNIYLKKHAIPSITTLLWYRHRLAVTVHMDKKNRIATQMMVKSLEKLYDKVYKDKPNNLNQERDRLNLLLEFHNKFNDQDCNNFISSKIGDDYIANLLKGKLLDEAIHIPKRNLQPEEQLWINLFVNSPTNVIKTENYFKELIKYEDCIIDLRMSKAPKFKTLISIENNSSRRSIFDQYYTPHGIMVDTFNTMSVYLYSLNEEKLFKHLNTIGKSQINGFNCPGWRLALYDALERTYKENFSNRLRDGQLYTCEFLIIYMASLDNLFENHFDMRYWIAGDGRLQDCIKYLMNKLPKNKLKFKPKIDEGEDYSVDIFIDFEMLCNFGLIDHLHHPVGGPNKTTDEKTFIGPWIGARIDRRISMFGKIYYNKYLKNSMPDTTISKTLTSIIEKNLNSIREYFEIENSLRGMTPTDPEYKKIKKNVEKKRDELNEHGCPLLTSKV